VTCRASGAFDSDSHHSSPRGTTGGRMPTGHSLAPLADVHDRQRRHRPPELVVRCKHHVVAMPVLARRRHEIGEPVEVLKRRELDDAIGSRPRGLPPTPPPAPFGHLVPREHVSDLGDAAGWGRGSRRVARSRRGGRAQYRSMCSRADNRHVVRDERARCGRSRLGKTRGSPRRTCRQPQKRRAGERA
jgi:hypothetical protein